jgi:hypothetical protein
VTDQDLERRALRFFVFDRTRPGDFAFANLRAPGRLDLAIVHLVGDYFFAV